MEVTDPVCKMAIEDKDAVGTSEYMGKTYYFCSDACKERFEKDPLRYLIAGGYFIPPEE
ncbi:MAG: YHS domain-containing protein [Syntrophales bacterium]